MPVGNWTSCEGRPGSACPWESEDTSLQGQKEEADDMRREVFGVGSAHGSLVQALLEPGITSTPRHVPCLGTIPNYVLTLPSFLLFSSSKPVCHLQVFEIKQHPRKALVFFVSLQHLTLRVSHPVHNILTYSPIPPSLKK